LAVIHVCSMAVGSYCVVFINWVVGGVVCDVVRLDVHTVTGGMVFVAHEYCRAVFTS
jgi:hypothetical protein